MNLLDHISNIRVDNSISKSDIRSVQLINRLIFISSLIAVIYLPILFWLKAFWMGGQLACFVMIILSFLYTPAKIKVKFAVPVIALIMIYHMTSVSIVIQNSQLELYIILITLIQFAVIRNNFFSFFIFSLGIIAYFVSIYTQDTTDSLILMNNLQKITMITLNSIGIFIGGLYLIFQVKNSSTKYQIDLLKERKKIMKQNNKINIQVKIIEDAHKEITDSINYSRRIQKAILPSSNKMKSALEDYFILYKPKDIVAGDFYWVEQSKDAVSFAVADCTGHGVPGAMMSVVCNSAINRSVREFNLTKPNEVLDQTRKLIIKELDSSSVESVKDGMDIAFCSLHNNKLNYAGANIKLYIIRAGKIITYKADKQPIGLYIAKSFPYTNHEITLEDGDMIYLITDGYVDQFGGENTKKFKTPALKKLLLAIQGSSMEQQKQILNTTFENWKGSLEQIDDVCVMGVQFNKQP
jgi:serine phosphatase RsbU (regulator of sigma subunit)